MDVAWSHHYTQSPPPPQPTWYSWKGGTSIHDYAASAITWKEHTDKEEFVQQIAEVITYSQYSNEERSAKVEQFLLQQAVLAGVVKEHKPTRPFNPNKWGKSLAPWFTEECRTYRKAYIHMRRSKGRDNEATIQALKKYREACITGKYAFAREVPDMLKYKPK